MTIMRSKFVDLLDSVAFIINVLIGLSELIAASILQKQSVNIARMDQQLSSCLQLDKKVA